MAKQRSRLSALLLVVACVFLSAVAGYLSSLGKRGIAYSIMGAIIVLVEWFRHRETVSAWALIPAAALVAFYLSRARDLLTGVGAAGRSPTFDIYALYVDGSFGFQPSVWIHHLVAKNVSFELLFQTVYEALPVAIAAAYAFNLASSRRWKIFGTMTLVGVIGVQCYRLFPICGPAYLPFGNECFYYHGSCSLASFFNGTPYIIRIDDAWSRNGMPSLHMSWALVAWWTCLKRKPLRYFMLLFAVLTAIATLAYGEHYLIDLAAAVPFSVMIWFLCMDERSFSQAARVFPIVGGALGYLGWVWSLRFNPQIFYVSPVIPWLALFASISYAFLVCPLRCRSIATLYRGKRAAETGR
jgi:hypothetical protein